MNTSRSEGLDVAQINAELNAHRDNAADIIGPYARDVEMWLAAQRQSTQDHIAEMRAIDQRLESLHVDWVRSHMETRFAWGLSFDHHGGWLGFGRYHAYVVNTSPDHILLAFIDTMIGTAKTYAWKDVPSDEIIIKDTGYRDVLKKAFSRQNIWGAAWA